MSEEDRIDPWQGELEMALKSIAPASAKLDPVGAAFVAGSKTARRKVHAWQSISAVLLLAGSAGWVVPVYRTAAVHPTDAGSSVLVAQHAPEPFTAQPPAEQSVVMLRRVVEEKGINALPPENLPDVQVIRASDLF